MFKQSLTKSINCVHWKTNLLSGWGPSVAFNPRISASGVLCNIQNRITKHQYTPVVDHGWQGSQKNLNPMQLVLWAFRFTLAKQHLCMCIKLFCTFLWRHCMTTAWKCLISCIVEDVNTKKDFVFLFLNLITLFQYSPPEKIPSIWRIEQELNERNEVWSSAFSLFKWHFCSRRLRCCLSYLFT